MLLKSVETDVGVAIPAFHILKRLDKLGKLCSNGSALAALGTPHPSQKKAQQWLHDSKASLSS